MLLFLNDFDAVLSAISALKVKILESLCVCVLQVVKNNIAVIRFIFVVVINVIDVDDLFAVYSIS